MKNYIFNEGDISQHIVKYGVDVRPSVVVKQENERLQGYCNWLVEEYPQAFETMLSGPNEIKVQKTFVTARDKHIEMPTFAMTKRGPCFIFPIRIMVEETEDFDLPDRDKVFRKALKKFRQCLPGRKVMRVGVIHELIFDCGNINSIEVLASALSTDMWRDGIANISIHLENPKDNYNVNVDLSPSLAQRVIQSPQGTRHENVGYGISVKVDINNRDMISDLDDTAISGLLAYAEDYVPDELIRFLNGDKE